MNKVLFAALALAMSGTAALADAKPSDADAAKLKEVADAWGFTGGQYEQETEGSGIFEINDTKGKDGSNYDVKIGKDFKVISITAD